MGIANLSYEECRRKRLEENKKRMEALNLPLLSQALIESSPSKSSPSKIVKPRTIQKQLVVVRRSSRVAKQSAPVYAEVLVDRVVIPRRVFKPRDFSNRVYASDEGRRDAFERAEKLQSGLDSKYPILIRSMLPSHVTGGFWLGLPTYFKKHLPKNDGVITLIDEDGDEYPVIYLARKAGLSGGWMGFAIAHKLVDGDAVVFHVIKSSTCKVYIIRMNSSSEDSGCGSS